MKFELKERGEKSTIELSTGGRKNLGKGLNLSVGTTGRDHQSHVYCGYSNSYNVHRREY